MQEAKVNDILSQQVCELEKLVKLKEERIIELEKKILELNLKLIQPAQPTYVPYPSTEPYIYRTPYIWYPTVTWSSSSDLTLGKDIKLS